MTYQQWSESDGMFMPVGNTKTKIEPGYYDLAQSQGQLYFVPVRPRTDDLLKFSDSASVAVLDSIRDFWEREPLFVKYGLPHKRGVLLYGPPGSGKSCTLQLIARDVVDRGGIVINFPGNSQLFIDAYRALRDIQPETPVVVLLEDFEVTIQTCNESKLLNLLDGVENLHRVVFLATTNYPEMLKDRVTNRPSRFDVRIRVGHPSASMRRQYLTGLVHEDDNIDIERYVADTAGMSLAHVKELFVAVRILGNDYAQSVQRLSSMNSDKVTSLDEEPELDFALLEKPSPYI